MEHIDIQDIWRQNEMILEQNRKFNIELLKEVKIDKAKSSLKNLLFLPISTLLFNTLVASYALCFTVLNYEFWYFVFSGLMISFFSIWFVISSIKQLKLILLVDYKNEILTIQEDLSKIKIAVVKNLRIASYLLPFGPFIALFLFKAILNIDLMEVLDFKMLVSFGISTVVLEIISLVVLRALKPKNINKKWLNWLLMGNGSQVNDAIVFLDDIKTFEENNQ
ncbi:hypothetical protein SAMN05444411_101496 [Lutibacter oricola]|uniref:Uncharacterized protein n=1 Tax=Lutibacter oricola TaxID=762486 RepID=A0A1H2SNK6_9FLAO|nr:hypothetical protein [Lutibacter oricola]SDW33216.1 hypothetical protein SAMN05444411_101496 [Lutibacter oricola]